MDTRRSRYVSEAVKRDVVEQSTGCFHCLRSIGPFEFDHLIPFADGGSNDISNIVLACLPCNRSKKRKSVAEFYRWQAGRIEKRALEILRRIEQ